MELIRFAVDVFLQRRTTLMSCSASGITTAKGSSTNCWQDPVSFSHSVSAASSSERWPIASTGLKNILSFRSFQPTTTKSNSSIVEGMALTCDASLVHPPTSPMNCNSTNSSIDRSCIDVNSVVNLDEFLTSNFDSM